MLVRQLIVTYSYDRATAWYIASLVTNPQIIGIAADFLLSDPVTTPILIAPILVPIFLVFPLVLRRLDALADYPAAAGWQMYISMLKPNFVPVWRGVIQVVIAAVVIFWAVRSVGWWQLLLTIASIMLFFTAMHYAALDFIQCRSLPVRFLRLWGLMCIALLVAAAWKLDTGLLSLPILDAQTDAGSVQGRLIRHGDGYWYIINESDNTLRLLPDGEIKGSTIRGGPRSTPTVGAGATPKP